MTFHLELCTCLPVKLGISNCSTHHMPLLHLCSRFLYSTAYQPHAGLTRLQSWMFGQKNKHQKSNWDWNWDLFCLPKLVLCVSTKTKSKHFIIDMLCTSLIRYCEGSFCRFLDANCNVHKNAYEYNALINGIDFFWCLSVFYGILGIFGK